MQLLNLVLLVVACVVVAYAAPPNIGGCPIFPASFEYNKPIETYEVDPLNNCYLNRIISNAPTPYLRLDMGNDLANGYGIPYSSGAPDSIDLDLSNGYFSESDCLNASNPTQLSRPCCEYGASACNGKWAAPYTTEIESQSPSNPNPTSGDRHTSYIDTTNCLLYETFATAREGGTTWSAASSAVYDLNVGTFPQRPAGWTSADAAGLPILPGLMKYPEFSTGTVDHALRFTAEVAQMAYVSPASHLGGSTNAYDLPYGIRLRLKADFNATGYSAQGQVLIATLKKYGMFFADQGTGFYISGTSDTNWDNNFFDEINQDSFGKRIHIDNFEVVQMPTAVYYGYSAGSVTCTQSPNSSPATSLTSNSVAGQVKDILLN